MDYHKRGFWPVNIGTDATEGERHLIKFITTQADETLNPETVEFIKQAFSMILLGEDPKKALKLKIKQGVKGSVAKARDKQYRISVAVMVNEKLECGLSKDDASQAVADELRISFRTVKRCCTKENRIIAKSMIKDSKQHDR